MDPTVTKYPTIDSVMIRRTRTGGVSIVPTETGCIVLPGVGVSVYSRKQMPKAWDVIVTHAFVPDYIRERINTHPLILALPLR